jgi:hypothetical protein
MIARVSSAPRRRADVDVTALPLSPIDGFVLSRIDGVTDLAQLVQVTGLPAERVGEVLERLRRHGALEGGGDEPEPATQEAELQEVMTVEDEEPPTGAAEVPEDDGAPEPEEAESPTHRALYMQALSALTLDERVGRAKTSEEPELSAWCFDGSARVIAAVLENPRTGLGHARLIARHHRDAQGIELLCGRAAFTADDVVRRELLRNPQLQGGLVRRLFGQRRALEQWKWSSSREVTEQARRTLKETFRARFSSGPAEEKVEVILKTDGRCIAALSGLGLDSKTAAMLCARTYASPMLVQNLARWSACPPPLIAHLLRQAIVKRQPQLKTLLNQHPNAPRS